MNHAFSLGHVDDIDAPLLAYMRARRRRERLAVVFRDGVPRATRAQTTWVGDLQQGDGGKGAMTDRLARTHDVIVRVQGGDNAGHTTVFLDADGREVTVKNHIIPSGMRHPGTIGILGNGVLLNAERFGEELTAFGPVMPDIADRVFVSGRAHLILPLHRFVDAREEGLKERRGDAIGTTRRGVGPANISKVNRVGIRVTDLRDWSAVENRVRANVDFFDLDAEHAEANLSWLDQHKKLLLDREVDSVRLIDDLVGSGLSVLFEGAQGPVIDLEHGIYPYVTTAPTAAYSVASGAGFDLARIDHRVGVLKVYQTMVGNGAFVSEDHAELGTRLRAAGAEFGTTTGRARRCGWLDLVHARWAAELNGFTSVVLTKLDCLDEFEQVGVCVAYERDGELITEFAPEHAELSRSRPVYRYFDGWLSSTRAATSFADLPVQAREFVEFIAAYLGAEVGAVTTGPRDVDMLVRPGTRFSELVR
ncbi:adenylosuccinate synthetase [Dactylosporangium cerinum]|uniref:Adenylosuccinate synthetase n=1 Tax=Dactylosporangium cerinum TaxID=1434730 RepID=A0ABV9VRS7_9ACTN